jgi:lactoylglutathione lyase
VGLSFLAPGKGWRAIPSTLELAQDVAWFDLVPSATYQISAETRCISLRRGAARTLTRIDRVINLEELKMEMDDFPAPREGFVLTHFLVVSDQDRSREFYKSLFDGKVVLERDPVIMKVANSWLILNNGGGPTDDKPTVTLTTPPDANRTSAFLNVRVADIQKAYTEWSARGAEFLTEPKDHGREIRAYIRDPDGHLIEVGQATGVLT